MYHFLSLHLKNSSTISSKEQIEYEIFLQGQQDHIDYQKKQVQLKVVNEFKFEKLQINIGSRIQAKEEIENKKGAELIIFRLLETLEFLKKISIIEQIESLEIFISHSTAPVLSPIIKWIEHFKNVTKLEIVSAQSLNEQLAQEFFTIISEKVINLQSLVYDVAQAKGQDFLIKKQEDQKQEKLQEITLRITRQIEDLKLLLLFPNLSTLKLLFPISSSNNFIESALIKVSALVPQIISLEVVLLSALPCNLSPICNLQNLQSIKLDLKSTAEIDLSKLKNLRDINLQLPDPLEFFCKQKNIPNLEKLSFCNAEVISQKFKEENKNVISQYQKKIKQQKSLTQLIISNQGCLPKSLLFLKRDLEVISVLTRQLQELQINLIPLEHRLGQEIDSELVNILCKLLDCCKDEMKIILDFKTDLMSIEGKCDLGLAIRRLIYDKNFILNGISIQERLIKLSKFQFIRFIHNYKQQDDESLFLLKLGYLCKNEVLASKTLRLQKPQLNVLKKCISQQNETLQSKIREVFKPYLKLVSNKYQFSVSQYYSKDIISLTISSQITHRAIIHSINHFPNLLNISASNNDIVKILPKDNEGHIPPMRCIQLNLSNYYLNLMKYIRMVQLKDHVIRQYGSQIHFISIPQAIEVINLLAEENNRVLLFQNKTSYYSNDNGKQVSEYSYSIVQQILFAVTYFKDIANLLTINPTMVFLDLYF